ncbi:MAG: DNA polymerase III subunit gamma/tau [Coriobacteriales bacterium]|nr:DNA polymerase III subunit gamma/tau [Coriobacteriales bacterium]
MSLSLYRKYRPETFTDVTGQEHVETTLKNAVQTGSVSHAYLFCGPRGTGKTTTARLLAKALLCDQAPTEHPDGTCPACREIADGLHPDVYELDAASRTGVENVREEIIGRVQFSPTRGAWKIYIIDEVHMLSTAAFNALLKTLEEPPAHVLFVLCTTDPHKVPETIQSRCQRFDFHRLSEQQISARLAYISEQEGYTAEPEALALIAQRSQGGMRDAISSLEQVAVFGSGTVSFAAAESMLGEVSTEQLFSVARLIAQRDVAGCFAWVASFTQNGTDIAQFVRDLSSHARNLYVASVLGDSSSLAEIVEADDAQVARYREQAALFGSSDRLANILVVLGDLNVQMRTAANARLALEIALTRMARPDADLTLESLAARIAVLEQAQLSAVVPAAPPAATPAATPAAPPSTPPAATPAVPPAATPVPTAADAAVTPAPAVADVVATPAPTPAPAPAPAPVPATMPEAPASTTPTPAPVAAAAAATAAPSADPVPSADAVPSALNSDDARRLLLRVEKELVKAKRHSVATSLGGFSVQSDPTTEGLLIELPNNAAFAKQNLERLENQELLQSIIERLHGTKLPLTFVLGPKKEFGQPLHTELFAGSEAPATPAALQTPAPAFTSVPTPASVPPSVPAADSAAAPNPDPDPAPTPEPSLEDIVAKSFGVSIPLREIDSQD